MDGTPVSSQSVSLCPPTALTTADRSRGSLTLYGLFEVGPVAVRNSLSPGSAGLVRPMFVRSTVKARRFRERERANRATQFFLILSLAFIGQNVTRTPIPDHCCERTRHERRAARSGARDSACDELGRICMCDEHVLRRCSMCATRTHSSDLRSSTPPRVAASSCALPLVMSMASCTSSQKSFQAMLSR